MIDGNKSSGTSAIIVSISSDIGLALAERWQARGVKVCGTYRTMSARLKDLDGVRTVRCDLADPESVRKAGAELVQVCPEWDYLVLCPGLQDPVGSFAACGFDDWGKSVQVNFL